MMKLKILQSCAGLKFSFSAGETADLDEQSAQDLIQAKYAKSVGGKQTAPPVELPKEGTANGESNHAADSGAGKSEGVPNVDAGTANQSGAGANGKQSAESGT